ncbi:hypothetical protein METBISCDRAFT_21605 [Metschnikowia bicuspidata]|uniref:Tyrosine specific protein phosphatases domain-containing protein n=1 Tax=Metschnikowia bicuspidata TaxID=27322 RepID=A0A4P9ZGV1_9ASCO|nr:hypothetical protein METBISCDRAFT_21605 [Metschnikowia bicuspidata]
MTEVVASHLVEHRPKLVKTSPQRINLKTTLADKFSLENVKLTPWLDVGPAKYMSVLRRVHQFNTTLTKDPKLDVFVLKTALGLLHLLDLYYSCENPLPQASEMFPYLHGLSSIKQRAYFHKDFDAERDISVLALNREEIERNHVKFSDITVPQSAFHLLTVNSVASPNPSLINSVHMDDLLVLRTASGVIIVLDEDEYTLYEPFDIIYRLHRSSSDELKTRNYELQIKHMAPLSHFLVYNDKGDAAANREAAKLISLLMGTSRNPIYIVDFSFSEEPFLQPFLNKNVQFPFCDPANETKSAPATNRLALLEQTLMRHLNGLKCVFNGLYVGDALNYHQIMSHPGIAPVEFSVYICCHDRAHIPSRKYLEAAIRALNDEHYTGSINLEFPDFMGRYGTSISEQDLLNYMNFFRFIKIAIRSKKNVFVYSYCGFAGSSLLLASYGLFSKFGALEDFLLRMFQRLQPRICLTREDFFFLKSVEPYTKHFKRCTTRTNGLLYDIALEKEDGGCSEIKSNDWFKNEINLPPCINGSIFLGSVEQASSWTVLSSLNIKKVVSIDDKPTWFSHLNLVFQHEATDDTSFPVVKPIFSFNDGKSLVYEVTLGSNAVRSKLFKKGMKQVDLTSFIYIYNIRDDGKDSFQQLLQQCPEDIQSKVLVDPRLTERVLYHCRVGVSRSATLVIASLMKYFCISFLESYMFVRVQRYNMIIQPNLRLFYELYAYDEHLRIKNGSLRRTHCWWTVCDQVFRLNKPYMR